MTEQDTRQLYEEAVNEAVRADPVFEARIEFEKRCRAQEKAEKHLLETALGNTFDDTDGQTVPEKVLEAARQYREAAVEARKAMTRLLDLEVPPEGEGRL